MPYVFNPFTGNLDWTADGLPTLATGSVTFGGSSGELAEDNRNFNWQNTQKTLAVSSSFQERVTNGGFTGSAAGWTLASGWTYSSNSVSHSANGTGTLQQSISMSVGERYEVSFTISNLTVASVTVSFAGNVLGTISANGTYVYRVVSNSTSAGIVFVPTLTSRFTVDNVSAKQLSGGTIQTGDLLVQGASTSGVLRVSAASKSNFSPGTTRHAIFENSGGNTYIDFKFSGTDRSHIGTTSTGDFRVYSSGGNYFALYNKATNSLYQYATPTAFGQYSKGSFQGRLMAGSISDATSALQSAGGTALKVRYITANQTLDDSATKWIVDPSAAACTGTPTTACSSYTTEAACIARDNHGGCVWSAGTSCSVYNGDEYNCTNTTGCTWDTADCSAFGDESTCTSYSGCSWNYYSGDCSGFGDEGTCLSYSGCSWDGISCSGSYDYYACEGSYATGTCSGSFGGGCSGTATCSGIDDQTNCNNEAGCSWQTAITLTLPDMQTCPDRDYWIYNVSSTNADVILVPTGSQQIDHTTSYTLSNYKDWVHISPLYNTISCAGLNEGTCGSTAGCFQNYSNCSWNSNDAVCEGGGSCSSYVDEYSCNEATYFSSCSGSYVASANWYVFGR